MRKKAVKRKGIQLRAENLKGLQEQRAEKLKEMQKLVETADTEKRAFSNEEKETFDNLKDEIAGIDATIEAIETTRTLEINKNKNDIVSDILGGEW